LVDGIDYSHWGARGMPGIDVVLGTSGGVILLAYFLLRSRQTPFHDKRPIAAKA